MPEQDTLEVPDVDFGEKSADDWMQFLREHDDLALVLQDHDGVHSFEYSEYDGRVIFYAKGSMGYDEDGTRSALEAVAAEADEPNPDGIWLDEKVER